MLLPSQRLLSLLCSREGFGFIDQTKMNFPHRAENLLLFLLFMLCFISSSSSQAFKCSRTCGSAAAVPYPFGFSDGCPIRLNCSTFGESQLGEYIIRNITPNSLWLYIPPACNRSIHAAAGLFGNNYALTATNALFMRNCSVPSDSCSIPTDIISLPKNSTSCDLNDHTDYINCYSTGRTRGFFSVADYTDFASDCKFLFTSVKFVFIAESNKSTLEIGTAEIGWWLNGDCRCSANARCDPVGLPARPNSTGFRCSCNEGFFGDGFADGDGCSTGGGVTGTHLTAVVVGLVAAAAAVAFFLTYVSLAHCIHGSPKNKSKKIEAFLKDYGSLAPKRYNYSDLKKITKCFCEKLGQGGYGSVYKGTLPDGRPVAVKILKDSEKNGEEFMNEIASIGRTSHVNVVSLLGFCFDSRKRALVYEFMPNGSLEKYIFSDKPKTSLSWDDLFKIAVGIARGLEYLHRGCNTRIVHFDIKPHNILLDEEFCPKISDFGLAKLCPKKVSILSMEDARGTIGYIAPEVISRNFGVVSTKSDVYGYGMMILEMVAGRRNVNEHAERSSEVYFPYWAYDHLDRDEDLQACDVTAETEETARKMILVSLWCIQTFPENRPSMSRVVEMLQGRLADMEMPPKPSFSSRMHSAINSTT